jgi:nicotinamidase-related amidase
VAEDCCGDVNQLAHDNAMRRVEQAGAKPVTSLSTMLEWQRDWANRETYDAGMDAGQTPIERSFMNAWDDKNFVAAIEKTGRKKIVLSGLWTETCVAPPTIQAIHDGYEIYGVGVFHSAAVRVVMSPYPGKIALSWGQMLPLKLLVSTGVNTTGTSKIRAALARATVLLMID